MDTFHAHFFPQRRRPLPPSDGHENTLQTATSSACAPKTKIVHYNFHSANEATINRHVKQIAHYPLFFSPLANVELLKPSQFSPDLSRHIETTGTKEFQYYLFTYENETSAIPPNDLLDTLYGVKSVKEMLYISLQSFEHLLYGLHLLNEKGICFFHLSPSNILFFEPCREKPLLAHFENSILLSKLNLTYISKIMGKIDNFTYLPFEVHLLYYFIHHHLSTLSYSFVEEFCEQFVANFHVLRLFSPHYREKYHSKCVETLKKYVNEPRETIIRDLFRRSDKWDVFGVSVIYLHIFGSISNVSGHLKEGMLGQLVIKLSPNIHPNSECRMSLEETLNVFEKTMNAQPSWEFANELVGTDLLDRIIQLLSS